jgi:two-component system sporulation sensor kinase A
MYVSTSLSPVKNSEGRTTAVLGVVRDITERRKTEEELSESEARYRHISSVMSDIAYSCHRKKDDSYSIKWMTDAAEKITGYSIDEIKAKQCWKFLIVKEDMPLFEKHVIGLSSGSSSSCELRLRHKNGDIVWVASFAKCLQEPEGSGYRLYGGLKDITDRRRSEEELQKSERHKMMGTFISGIANEIRNPLVSVKGFFQLLNDKETSEKDKQEIAGLAVNEIKRMESLLDSLLSFARPSKGESIDSDIHKLISDSIVLLKHDASKQGIKMNTHLDAGHSHTLVDPKQLQQVFLNLSMNALDAMKKGGTLRISTSYLKDQNIIRVTFRDTGHGIKKELMPRLFEPFFTTKENGTGLGLPISQRIIENYKGKMTVESKEGKGTSVHVTLPAS